MPRLTKKFLDGLKPKSHDVFAWDSETRGFGVRLKPTGTKTFFVQYRNAANRTRRLVIGQYGVLTVELARDLARERLFNVLILLQNGRLHATLTLLRICATGTCLRLAAVAF